MSDLLTVSQTARELHLTRSEVLALAEQGELTGVQVGASEQVYFPRAELAKVCKPAPASIFRDEREKLSSRMALARSCRAIEQGL